jgi:ferric iron reductase protein FhuF
MTAAPAGGPAEGQAGRPAEAPAKGPVGRPAGGPAGDPASGPVGRPARAADVGAGLRRGATIGPFFAVEIADGRGDGGLRPVRDLYRDGLPLAGVIDAVWARLPGAERRVAASLFALGYAARLWSVPLGCWAVAGIVPDLDPDTVRFAAVPGTPVRLVVHNPDGRYADAPDCAADLLVRWVVERHLRPFVGAVVDSGLARGLLWGNVASALVGAAGMVASRDAAQVVPARPERCVEALAARLLDRPPLAGTTRHRVLPGGRLDRPSVIRRSCCLYYRVPGGGTCGDCPLTPPRRPPPGNSGET